MIPEWVSIPKGPLAHVKRSTPETPPLVSNAQPKGMEHSDRNIRAAAAIAAEALLHQEDVSSPVQSATVVAPSSVNVTRPTWE